MRFPYRISLTVVFLFLFASHSSLTIAQRPIVITADQPNVWTLEQAHYLLAQMHRRNLDLKASDLGDLDPNAINATRLDALRSLLDISAAFDESISVKNRELKDLKGYNATRRQELIAERNKLDEQLMTVMTRITDTKIKRAQTQDEDEQKVLDAEIKELEILRDFIKEQKANKNTELNSLTATGDYQTTPLPGATTNKQSAAFDSALGEAVKEVVAQFSGSPQLNASLRLDNYLQMQYEILSKQLTLLRDEVGAGERLIFLEMPQSINTSYDKADNKWAQSWWKIAAYTQCIAYQSEDKKTVIPCSKLYENDDYADFYRYSRFSTADVMEQIGKTTPALETYKKRLSLISDEVYGMGLEKLLVNGEEREGEKISFRGILRRKLGVQFEEYKKAFELHKEAKKNEDNRKKELAELEKAGKELRNYLFAAVNENEACTNRNPKVFSTKCREEASRLQAVQNASAAKTIEIDQKRQEIKVAEEEVKKNTDKLKDAEPLAVQHVTDVLNNFIANGDIAYDSAIGKLFNDRYMYFRAKGLTNTVLFRRLVIAEELGIGLPISSAQKTIRIDKTNLKSVLSDETQTSDPLSLHHESLNGDSESKEVEENENNIKYYNRSVRVIDMFPKQSSLNVNELKMESHAFSLRFLFKLLTGFSASANYERNREKYSQFVQQELYSSAFGKGSTQFGWTFNPMPGTKRILSGAKTTFAVMVVPKDATSIILQARGAYFSRASVQPNDIFDMSWIQGHNQGDKRGWTSKEAKTFVVPIPDAGSMGNNEFFVSKLVYKPAEKGKRLVLSIQGRNFSSQIGILINGVPLKPSLGLGQPYIRDDSNTARLANDELAKGEVTGSFERIDSDQVVASFKLDDKFEDFPSITIVAPGKALELRTVNSMIVDDSNSKTENTWDKADYMFGTRPKNLANAVKVDKVEAFKGKKCTETEEVKGKVKSPKTTCIDHLNILITGKNLDKNTYFYVNSQSPPRYAIDSFTVLIKEMAPPAEKKIQVSVVSGDGSVDVPSIDNPYFKDKEEAAALTLDLTYKIGEPTFLGYQQNFSNSVVYAVFRMTVEKFSEKVKASHGASVSYRKIEGEKGEVIVKVDSSILPNMIDLIEGTVKNSLVLYMPREQPRGRNRRTNDYVDNFVPDVLPRPSRSKPPLQLLQ